MHTNESTFTKSNQKQLTLWMAGIFTLVSLTFFGFSFYAMFILGEGETHVPDLGLLAYMFLMVLINLIGVRMIRGERMTPAAWMLFLANAVFLPIVTALSTETSYILVSVYLSVFSSLLISLVIPKTSRRKAILAAFIGLGVISAIELWNPAFRAGHNHLESFTPVIIILVVLASLAFVARYSSAGNIRTKLITIFAAVAIFSMGSVALLGDWSLRKNLTASIVESQASLATAQGFQIGQAITGQLEKLKGLATIKTIQAGAETASRETRPEDTADIEELNLAWRSIVADQNRADPLAIELLYNPLSTQLRNFRDTFPENLEILLTDQKGFSIAATDFPSNYYQADSLWWRTAHTTGRYIGQPIYDPATNSIALDIAVPVSSYVSGEFVGVLRATVHFDMLADLLVEGLRGQTGYSIIYQPNDQQIKLRSLGNGNYEIIQDFAPNNLQEFAHSPNTHMELSLGGVSVLASSAPVRSYSSTYSEEGASTVDDLNWRVIVVQEKSEALQFVNIQARNNLLLVLIIAIVVVVIAFFLGRLITHPIIQLNEVAIQIASGNLTAEARVKSRDEIGTLAATFNNMTSQLRNLVGSLEQRVVDRTHDLELAAEVGRTITEKIVNLDELLSTAVELIRSRFDLYYTQVYLADAKGRSLTLRAGTGEVGKQLLDRKHNLLIDSSSLNGQAVLEKQAVIVKDTLQSATFKPNSLLQNTRSEGVVPLIVGDRVIGVLDMQSEQPDAFNETNLAAFKTLAGQLAIAIQNAALLEQAEEARAEVEAQIRHRSEEGWQDFLNAIEQGQKVGLAYNLTNINRLDVDEFAATSGEYLSSPLVVMGAELGMIKVAGRQDQDWTASEAEVVHAATAQLAQHLENLRLLAQAKRYQAQAEQAVRRLTREGWDHYKQSLADSTTGYAYDLVNVQPLSANSNGHSSQTFTQPLLVRDETIGELAIHGMDHDQEASEIIAAVAQQLSGHIENLRLLEQTQQRSLDLEEAQTFLDSVIESLPHMLFVKDAEELRFLRWNKAAEKLVGFSQDEMLGKSDYDFFPKEEADFFTMKDREVLTSGQPLDIPEETLNTSRQGVRYVHTRKAPIYGLDGKPKYLLGVAEDITERKKSEEIIRQAHERAQIILESVTIPMVITRISDNHLTFVNPPALERTQFKYEDVINQPSPNFYVHIEDRKSFIAELHAKGRVSDKVVQLRGANDRVFWALMSARTFDYQGEASILTTFMDITDRIQAEEAVVKRAAELQTVAEVSTTTATTLEPDRLLQTVVDLTKEQFGLYHAHIYLTNESWNTLLLAAGAGEVGRQMVSDGWSIPMDHDQSIVANAARNRQSVIANDLVRDSNSSFLSNQLLPDTRSEMAVPMIVGDQVLGVFDVQSDIVDYFTVEDANIFTTLATQTAIALQNARLYAEQAATVMQLRELDRLKSSFLANMSHELRTPLNSILGFTDVMLEGLDGPLTEYMDNDLRLVHKNGQHLLHLINDVLDMAKIEAGRMNLNPENFRAFEVMEEAVSITSTLASEKNLSLFLDEGSDQDVKIYADHTRLRQVMINLVNNAIKFTEKGEISLKVAPMQGGRILISVKDTGIGIAPNKLDAIFQEFTQVDSSTTRKAGGTGLGLPISRRLVEMHGGLLWAESTGVSGEGSIFYVELPIQARITEVMEKQDN